jgi:hypothetical protein
MEPAQESTPPFLNEAGKSNKIQPVIILGVIFLFIVVCITLFINFTTQGQKIINTINPTVERTLGIMEQLHGIPGTYAIQSDDDDTVVLGGTYYDPATSRVDILFDITSIVPSSTISVDVTQRKLAFAAEGTFITDLYGDTFVPVSEAYLDPDTTTAIRELGELISTDIKELFSDTENLYSIESDVNNFFIKINQPSNPWLVINKKTYKLNGVLLSTALINLTLIPEFQQVLPPKITLSLFGDILARESVVIRTEEEGMFDELWHDWEDFYYDCFRCVFKLGDTDDDGLDNTAEFVLGTNPLIETDVLSLGYPEAIVNFFSNGEHFKAENGGRTGISIFSTDIPESAKALTFEYSLPLSETDNDYLGLYINGSLQALLEPTVGSSTQLAAVPLPPEVVGTSSELAMIFNSFGPKGKGMEFKNISYLIYPERFSVTSALRESEYKVFINRNLLVEQIPLRLGEDQWSNSEFRDMKRVPAEQVFALHDDRTIPAVKLIASDKDSVGVIKRRIDEPNVTLSEICVSVEEGEKNGFIEFQFLPDGGNEYELVTVYDLDTLNYSGRINLQTGGFAEAPILLSDRGPGTLVIGVFSDGNGEAGATFANLEYYTEETWDLAFRNYGSVDTICRDLSMVGNEQ